MAARLTLDGRPLNSRLAHGACLSPEDQATLSAYEAYRQQRISEIADDLLAGKRVADGRNLWERSDCYAEFDLAEYADRAIYAKDAGDRLQAINDLADQVAQAAHAIAARIVDRVIAYEEDR